MNKLTLTFRLFFGSQNSDNNNNNKDSKKGDKTQGINDLKGPVGGGHRAEVGREEGASSLGARRGRNLGGLGDEGLVDVGDDTSSGDGGLDQGVELLVTADGELKVARGDTLDLEVLGGVSGELQHLSGEVLEDGGAVDGSGGTNTASVEGPLLEDTVHTANGELHKEEGLWG